MALPMAPQALIKTERRGEERSRAGSGSPGEPDCACLFRLLESILCSIREDSCYYNSVLFSGGIPSFSPTSESAEFLSLSHPLHPSQPHRQKSFAIWHLLSYGFTYIYDSRPAVDLLRSQGSVRPSVRLPQNGVVCVCETPHRRDNYITVSMVTHLYGGEHLEMLSGT